MTVGESQRTLTNDKIKHRMADMKVRGELVTKPAYGWRAPGKGKPLIEHEAEQAGIKELVAMINANPEIKMREILAVLNSPDCRIPAYCRKPDAKDRWSEGGVKRVLVKAGVWKRSTPQMKAGKVIKTTKAARANVVQEKHDVLFAQIKRVMIGNPTTNCSEIARRLIAAGLLQDKPSSEAALTEAVRRALHKENYETSVRDTGKEEDVAGFVQELIQRDPHIKIAEIIRQLTATFKPLQRAKSWHHKSVNALISKYNIKRSSLPLPTGEELLRGIQYTGASTSGTVRPDKPLVHGASAPVAVLPL